MGTIGFIDDYIKKFKNDKDGLSGKFKIIGQVGLGIIVGATMYFHEDITVQRHKINSQNTIEHVAQNNKPEFYP